MKNLEIIIVDYGSKLYKTWNFYEKINQHYSNVKVVKYKEDNNYASIAGFGARQAKGDYLLFLNDCLKMKDANSIADMAGYLQRKNTGVAGCRIIFSDHTIYHAGMIIGIHSSATNAFSNISEYDTYFDRALITQNYSAVGNMVLMTKRSLYDQVGGFSKEFNAELSSVDFCLRLRNLGYLVVYDAEACFCYIKKRRYESETIGDPNELDTFQNKWSKLIESGDPYYNKNLTLEKGNFSLRHSI